MSNSNYNYKYFFVRASMFFFVILFIFSVFPSTIRATHFPNDLVYTSPFYNNVSGEDVCAGGDARGGGLPGAIGVPTGLFVPVRDFLTEDLLDSIERDTAQIEGDTRAIRWYLKQLCYKEFSLDHSIQHAWMEVMGKLINRTQNWINTIYAGNPIYVVNPHVYYRNVDLGVAQALIREIECLIDPSAYPKADYPFFACPNPTQQIDAETGRIVIRSIEGTMVDRLFGDLVNDWTVTAPQEKEIYEDRDRHTTEAFLQGTVVKPNNVTALLGLATHELAQRQKVAREVEEQKLQWGRGFFPLEICGQQVFTKNPEDIRTCKTITPGALIQDLTSLVLGTVVRQIENADEYEEWISNRAFYAFNTVFHSGGLGPVDNSGLGGYKKVNAGGQIFEPTIPNTVIGPIQAAGNNPDIDGGELRIIWEDNINILEQQFLNGFRPKEKTLIYFNDTPLDPVF